MLTLLLMRHAKSSWKDSHQADEARSLTKRGQRDAEAMALLLAARKLVPALILCSTARRARETAEIVVEHSGFEGEISFSSELYQSSPAEYIGLLSKTAGENTPVMIVAHNPDMEGFLRNVCDAKEEMSTAAIACIQFDLSSWSNLTTSAKGNLISIWRPKEIE